MKSVIFIIVCLFLFKVTIVVGDSNICYVCEGVNSESCEHKEVECPDGSSCMTISEEFLSLGKISHSVCKRCEMNVHCNISFLRNVGVDVLVRSSQDCCSGNRCNSGNFQLPPLDTRAKGILCPFCYALHTADGCNATLSVPCLGIDDVCIRFRGAMKQPDGEEVDFSAEGCSSKTACNYGYKQLIGLKITKQLESTCYVPYSQSPVQEIIPKI